MKQILLIVAVAVTFAACNNKEHERKLQASRDSLKAIQQAYTMDSLKKANDLALQQKEEAERAQLAAQRRAAAASGTRVAGYSESGYQAPAAQKKGMSSAAKGALIGAGVGAVTGVIVDKKDGRGAIIGGAVGAGTGYAIGRGKDKKSGRVQ